MKFLSFQFVDFIAVSPENITITKNHTSVTAQSTSVPMRCISYRARPSIQYTVKNVMIHANPKCEKNRISSFVRMKRYLQIFRLLRAAAWEPWVIFIVLCFRPQELDEAARRRFVKRLYIPLPELQARCAIINNMMRKQEVSLTGSDIDRITTSTDGMYPNFGSVQADRVNHQNSTELTCIEKHQFASRVGFSFYVGGQFSNVIQHYFSL